MTRRYRDVPIPRARAQAQPMFPRSVWLRLAAITAAGLVALGAAGALPAAQPAQKADDPEDRPGLDSRRRATTRDNREAAPQSRPQYQGPQRGDRPAAAPVAPPVQVTTQRREERVDNRQERRDDRRDRVDDRRDDRRDRVEDRRDDRRDYRTDRRDDRRDDRSDRRDDRRYDRSPSRPPVVVNRPARPPVRVINTLPFGYRSYAWRGSSYYQHGGFWYRPYGPRFVVTAAPFGLFLPVLPPYYSTLWVGGSRFFFADGTYYTFDDRRRGYVVSRSPYGDDWEDEDDRGGGEGGDVRDEDLYIYPARGQSEQQQADDRYECHRWSVDQTQYDPTQSDYQRDSRAEYDRAMTACLTGRGYSVK